jgi:DNA-binding transcriptional LysR family regulator
MPGPQLQSAGSVEAVKRGIIANPQALGILPSYSVADEVSSGKFRPVELRPVLPETRLVALQSGSRPAHPGVADLLEELRVSSLFPNPRHNMH